MKVWGTGEDIGLFPSFSSHGTGSTSRFEAESYLQALRAQPAQAQSTRELDSLAKESDPELFFSGLVQFAGRELNRERPESAILAYQTVAAGAQAFPQWQSRAAERLQAMQGVGAAGPRVEYLLRDLAKQSLDPALLLAMTGAGLAYKTARLASLSGLAASPTARLFLSPGTRRFAASLSGFALEVPAFTLTSRAFHESMGQSQDWSAAALQRDLASGAFVLGGLKVGGGASAALERRLLTRLPSGLPAPTTAFQQAGMLSGIYLGHGLEQASGLRAQLDGATTLADSLVTLLQFNIAGRLTPNPLKENFARWDLATSARNGPVAADSLPGIALQNTALALPAGSKSAEPHAAHWMQSSSKGSDGKESPPPYSSRLDSARSQSSKPPIEHGVILRDALNWGSRQSRASADVTRMVDFVEAIREEMWKVLNLFADKPLARALGQSQTVYVRVKPIDGSLDNYEIQLSARSSGREVHPNYVEFILDANQGRLQVQDFVSQAAELNRLRKNGNDPSRGFLGYYRSILHFESAALQSAHLVAAMPAHVRTLVLQQATNYLRPALPAAPGFELPKFVRAPEPELASTNLVDYFPYVAEQARQEVEYYAENSGIRDRHLFRLQSLVQKLLTGLYARESTETRLTRFSYLQARLKPDPELPKRRIIEILTPAEAVQRQPLADEVIFNLVRHPSSLGESFAHLNHVYLRTDAKGRPIDADLRFQEDLGIGFNLKMRLNALSLESFDVAAAEKWLRDNGYINE